MKKFSLARGPGWSNVQKEKPKERLQRSQFQVTLPEQRQGHSRAKGQQSCTRQAMTAHVSLSLCSLCVHLSHAPDSLIGFQQGYGFPERSHPLAQLSNPCSAPVTATYLAV